MGTYIKCNKRSAWQLKSTLENDKVQNLTRHSLLSVYIILRGHSGSDYNDNDDDSTNFILENVCLNIMPNVIIMLSVVTKNKRTMSVWA